MKISLCYIGRSTVDANTNCSEVVCAPFDIRHQQNKKPTEKIPLDSRRLCEHHLKMRRLMRSVEILID